MRPPSGTGPPALQVQRQFEGNRFAKESQVRAYQQVLPVVGSVPTSTGVRGPLANELEETRMAPEGVQEGVAA